MCKKAGVERREYGEQDREQNAGNLRQNPGNIGRWNSTIVALEGGPGC
jgi:hypothetical protein